MRKKEISRKFDEIVQFAGVERYIDTPVKRYSSGMYVRLAFAVAAFLESEVLIVDEVLAVGDAEFQKKCLGKMGDISKSQGKTVLFVSHNMASIQSLCTSALLLKEGALISVAQDTASVIRQYLNTVQETASTVQLIERKDRKGKGDILISDVRIVGEEGQIKKQYLSGSSIKFIFIIINEKELVNEKIDITMSISRSGGQLITVLANSFLNKNLYTTGEKKQGFTFLVEKLPLMSGQYNCNIMIKRNQEIEDWVQDAFLFEVETGDYYNTGNIIPASHNSIFFDFKCLAQ